MHVDIEEEPDQSLLEASPPIPIRFDTVPGASLVAPTITLHLCRLEPLRRAATLLLQRLEKDGLIRLDYVVTEVSFLIAGVSTCVVAADYRLRNLRVMTNP